MWKTNAAAAIGCALAGITVVIFSLAAPAHAHGFGQRFDLPIPLELYLIGAGAAVLLSFIVMALFVRGTGKIHAYPRVNLLHWRVGRALAHPFILFVLKFLSVSAFVLVLVAGLFGSQHPLQNIIHTAVWVIWWVGMAYFSALVGDVFALINPWKTLFAWAEALYRLCRPGANLTLGIPYPRGLGVWPAVALFLAFAWVELVWGSSGGSAPANLAAVILVYSVITWCGMLVFGKHEWLRAGEVFSVVFGLLARFAPMEVRVTSRKACADCPAIHLRQEDGGCVNCYEGFTRAKAADRQWNLRPYAVGLLADNPPQFSMMVFVLLVLSTVTFDGFLETPLWASLFQSLFAALNWPGAIAVDVILTLAIVVFPVIFFGVYTICCKFMAMAQGSGCSTMALARLFVYSIVPIAIAYHLAHYLHFFLIGGQLIIPQASDPFGFGWDLLGTADYRIDIGIVGAWFVWYATVAAIVVGHIAAVCLAHVTALRTFEDKRLALRSQYPLLILMVGYTMISLWILSQPIVESRPGG